MGRWGGWHDTFELEGKEVRMHFISPFPLAANSSHSRGECFLNTSNSHITSTCTSTSNTANISLRLPLGCWYYYCLQQYIYIDIFFFKQNNWCLAHFRSLRKTFYNTSSQHQFSPDQFILEYIFIPFFLLLNSQISSSTFEMPVVSLISIRAVHISWERLCAASCKLCGSEHLNI